MIVNYSEENTRTIWAFLRGKGLNDYAVAGLMGNIYAESHVYPNNLQNSYSKRWGISDEQYTAAVDGGTRPNFATDKAGYGLCQWTSSGRKLNLLNFCKARGCSIGNLAMQLDFLWQELTGSYKGVLKVLQSTSSVDEAARAVMLKFERPADQSEDNQKDRVDYAKEFYAKYADKEETKKEDNTMKNVKAGHTHPIVCLDAGHYGNKYNHSPVVPEYYESNMNWKLHLLLKEQLESYGIEVRRTRTNKAKDLALVSRGKASEGCDLFLSLHSNAASAENVDRPVGIYMVDDDCGAIDEMSKELAVLLSEVVAEVMQTKNKAQQYSKQAQSDRDGDGEKDDDYYGVLFGAHQVGTAAVILEHSFHTNARAAKWLLDDGNLAKMAQAEAEVIAEYFGMTKASTPAPDTTPAPAPAPATKKLYRVRKSWTDAASQKGAYENLENAKKDCPEDYTVYDWNGKAVYTKAAPKVKLDAAKSFDKSLAGTYRVTAAGGLNLRTGAATNKTQLEVMPYGSEFQCYGYHTGGWLYGVSASGKTGFCSKAYLAKK